MNDVIAVVCPWCWECLHVQIPIDSVGTMVLDCEVCCRPWLLDVGPCVGAGEERSVTVTRAY